MRHAAHKAGKDVPKQYAKPFTELQMFEDRLATPLSWRKPCKVFVNSMSDLFHKDVPDAFIDQVFGVMAKAYWHTFQVLTKRPERLAAYLTSDRIQARIIEAAQKYNWPRWAMDDVTKNDRGWNSFPYPNIHLGTSVENQATADERIPHLLHVPAKVRFLSMEPLLDRIILQKYLAQCECGHGHGFTACPNTGGVAKTCHKCDCRELRPKLHWVICGGESGHGARPCRPEWVRSIVKQCKEAGVPVFVKQMGGNVVTRNDMIEDDFNNGESGWHDPDVEHDINGFREEYQGADCRIRLSDKKGGDWSEWPNDLRVREFPEVAS